MLVLIGQPIGASFTSVVKSAAKSAYSVAQDPRVQRAAVAAAQAYAPKQYAQATMYADRARGLVRQPRPMIPQGMAPMPQQMAPMPQMPMEDEMPMAPRSAGPVQKGNMMGIAAIAGAGVLIFLLLRNR